MSAIGDDPRRDAIAKFLFEETFRDWHPEAKAKVWADYAPGYLGRADELLDALAALEDVTAVPPPWDVEDLARALASEFGPMPWDEVPMADREWRRDQAARIAIALNRSERAGDVLPNPETTERTERNE